MFHYCERLIYRASLEMLSMLKQSYIAPRVQWLRDGGDFSLFEWVNMHVGRLEGTLTRYYIFFH